MYSNLCVCAVPQTNEMSNHFVANTCNYPMCMCMCVVLASSYLVVLHVCGNQNHSRGGYHSDKYNAVPTHHHFSFISPSTSSSPELSALGDDMLADEDTSYLDAVSAPDPPSGVPQEKAKEKVHTPTCGREGERGGRSDCWYTCDGQAVGTHVVHVVVRL